MKRIGAASILVTMLLGLAAWAGSAIVSNKEEIATLKAQRVSDRENIIYIRQKVDKIYDSVKK